MRRPAASLVWACLALPGLLLAPSGAVAQVVGPNDFGYTATPIALDWREGSAAPLTLADDLPVAVALPWPFPWYGSPRATVWVADNGALYFDATSWSDFADDCLDGSSPVPPDVAAYWDDLDIGAGGQVRAFVDGDRFVVSWLDVPAYGGNGDGARFQVHLLRSGAVQFHWSDTDFGDSYLDDGAAATIGIQDGGSDPLLISCRTASNLAGTGQHITSCADADGDGSAAVACGGDDCDDGDESISPLALEVCDDGRDQDCDGADRPADADDDGFVAVACAGGDDCDDADPTRSPAVDADADGWHACLDCNDAWAAIHPGAPEICVDAIDNDCDGRDEDTDGDGDGAVDALCGGPDCDDADPGLGPGVDGDGDGAEACADCDDADPGARPGLVEVCDGRDNDCSGVADDIDADGDGLSPRACGGGDCDDTDPTVGAGTDADGDGHTACTDCDDGDPSVFPGAPEACDGIDGDCDGRSDGRDFDVGGVPLPPASFAGPGGALGPSAPSAFQQAVVWSGVVLDLEVRLGMLYEPVHELALHLVAPDGSTAVLADGVGPGGGAGFDGTLFDDEAPLGIGAGTPPYVGPHRPAEPLSVFDHRGPSGLWSLVVLPRAGAAGLGVLSSWSLDVRGQRPDDADGDGWTACGDCDDLDAGVRPDAPEVCDDGLDQDCDDLDSGGDQDGDGHVDADCGGDDCDDADPLRHGGLDADGDGADACWDCDDADPGRRPGAVEFCGDGVDQDCSGADDQPDADADGWIAQACGGPDCDDFDPALYPGEDADGDGWDRCRDCNDSSVLQNPDRVEVCADFLDNDCDGSVDRRDADGDGWLGAGCGGEDCDDADPAWHPGLDADRDGAHACRDCDDADGDRSPDLPEICDDGVDQDCDATDRPSDADGDGHQHPDCGGDDCDDGRASTFPGAPESCDGIDADCDGDSVLTDTDGDGAGDSACGGGDCDDADAERHPGAAEGCDGRDTDCDGTLGPGEWDADRDGALACADCDDTDAGRHPAAAEVCNGRDDDCDALSDEGFDPDPDGDGVRGADCAGDDCAPDDPDAFPGAPEVCGDGLDGDCADGDEPCGCGCGVGPGTPDLGVLLGVALAVRRRRR